MFVIYVMWPKQIGLESNVCLYFLMPTCCFLNPISVYLWMQSLHRDFSCTLRIQTKAKELWIRFVIFTKFQTHNALKSLFPTHLFRTTAFKKTFTWNCLAFYQLLLHLFAKQCKNEINFVLLNFSISLVRPWQRFAGKKPVLLAVSDET